MEFHREQRAIFALAGTVPVPSPFPASGRVTIGVFPVTGRRDVQGSGDQFFLKITQHISDREVETLIVRLEDVRAVRYCPSDRDRYDVQGWTLRTVEELGAELAQKKSALLEAAKTPHVEPEVEVYRRAIVYVPSAAPVLVRHEYGTTAANCGPLACPGCSGPRCPPCCGPCRGPVEFQPECPPCGGPCHSASRSMSQFCPCGPGPCDSSQQGGSHSW